MVLYMNKIPLSSYTDSTVSPWPQRNALSSAMIIAMAKKQVRHESLPEDKLSHFRVLLIMEQVVKGVVNSLLHGGKEGLYPI